MNNIRGFELTLKQSNYLHLTQLFAQIDLSDYCFQTVDAMIYRDAQCIPDGEEFVNALLERRAEMGNAWILQLVLQVFPKNEAITPIDSYEDFVKSKCKMVLLTCDVTYVEVYVKDPVWLSQLLNNAKQFPAEYLEIKTDENDARTRMLL